MKPYYQDEMVTIYHGDCREVDSALGNFDLLLTDPPYGIGRDGQKASTGSHGGRKAYDFKGWDDRTPELPLLMSLVSMCSSCVIWGGNFFHLPIEDKWLIWDKGQRIDQSDCELAWTNLGGAMRVFTLNRVSLMTDGACHPTQKPEALMRWCIGLAGPSVQTVFDPFMGSGTTLVAAKRLGLKAVGIDREESYCQIAAERCAQGVLSFT